MKHTGSAAYAVKLARFVVMLQRPRSVPPKVKPMRRVKAISPFFRFAHDLALRGPQPARFPRPCMEVRTSSVRYRSITSIHFRFPGEANVSEDSPVLGVRAGSPMEPAMGMVRQHRDVGRWIAAAEDVFHRLPADDSGSRLSA